MKGWADARPFVADRALAIQASRAGPYQGVLAVFAFDEIGKDRAREKSDHPI